MICVFCISSAAYRDKFRRKKSDFSVYSQKCSNHTVISPAMKSGKCRQSDTDNKIE